MPECLEYADCSEMANSVDDLNALGIKFNHAYGTTEFEPITSFDDPALTWHNGSPDEAGGSVTIQDGELTVMPVAKLDYWSRTFYQPLLIKSDAQTLLASVPSSTEVTLTTAFTLKPRAQFD